MKSFFSMMAIFLIVIAAGMAMLLPFWHPLWFIYSLVFVSAMPQLTKVMDGLYRNIDEEAKNKKPGE